MKRLVAILLVLTFCGTLFAQNSADSLLFQNFLRFAVKEKLEKKPAGERVAAVGKFFLGTPYVAFTLEAPGQECLQVNLRGLDCTTLVENALALSRLVVSKTHDFDTYKNLLTSIRYRNGVLNGYPSRLHYASDWLSDNVQKGFVSFVQLGNNADTLYPNVSYMTSHPDAYAALKADPKLVSVIAEQEARINKMSFIYLPKGNVTEKAACIRNGDIIAISTSYPGLDFAHLGIAVRQKGKIHLLHASSTGKKVLISETPLSVYLAGIKKHSGIVVVRPL